MHDSAQAQVEPNIKTLVEKAAKYGRKISYPFDFAGIFNKLSAKTGSNTPGTAGLVRKKSEDSSDMTFEAMSQRRADLMAIIRDASADSVPDVTKMALELWDSLLEYKAKDRARNMSLLWRWGIRSTHKNREQQIQSLEEALKTLINADPSSQAEKLNALKNKAQDTLAEIGNERFFLFKFFGAGPRGKLATLLKKHAEPLNEAQLKPATIETAQPQPSEVTPEPIELQTEADKKLIAEFSKHLIQLHTNSSPPSNPFDGIANPDDFFVRNKEQLAALIKNHLEFCFDDQESYVMPQQQEDDKNITTSIAHKIKKIIAALAGDSAIKFVLEKTGQQGLVTNFQESYSVWIELINTILKAHSIYNDDSCSNYKEAIEARIQHALQQLSLPEQWYLPSGVKNWILLIIPEIGSDACAIFEGFIQAIGVSSHDDPQQPNISTCRNALLEARRKIGKLQHTRSTDSSETEASTNPLSETASSGNGSDRKEKARSRTSPSANTGPTVKDTTSQRMFRLREEEPTSNPANQATEGLTLS